MRGTTRRWEWTAAMLLATSTMAAADEASASRPDLPVLWSDPEQSVSDGVRSELVRQTAALFGEWGVTLGASSNDCTTGPVKPILVVLLDRTRLDDDGTRVLGETSARPLECPAVWILVPNVREMLERTERGAQPSLLARALARIAAHEILHVLAPGLGHASHGLMRPRLGPADLTRPWVPVNNAFRRALLEALRQPSTGQDRLGSP